MLAVGDQAAVQQVQRLDDPPRGLVLADGERVAELGPGIAGRPRALRDGDRAELLARGAVAGHVPARRQGVLGRDGAVAESRRQAGQPLPLRPGGCRPVAGLQAERRAGPRPGLQRRVGEHAGHRAGRAADDGERGELDRRPRGGAVGVDHTEQAQVPQPQYLGQADIEDAAGDPRADQQPVQVARLQARIGGREPHRRRRPAAAGCGRRPCRARSGQAPRSPPSPRVSPYRTRLRPDRGEFSVPHRRAAGTGAASPVSDGVMTTAFLLS